MQKTNESLPKSESRIQAECYLWFHNTYPDLRGLLYHVPNGEYRDKITAAKLQAMGVVSGIPDMVLHYKRNTWFFEVKDETGKVSAKQQAIHSLMRSQGFVVYIVRDLDSFKETVSAIVDNDNTDPLQIGLSKKEYFWRHKIYDWIYNDLGHNELAIIDELVEDERRVDFMNAIAYFIKFRFDEKDNFELLFTDDFEAIYRRDKDKPFEPIFYKGVSIVISGNQTVSV